MAANYFTCTLGQASSLGLTNPNFRNINSFLDSQARSIPDQPAVGFAKPTSDGQWDRTVYTFSSLRRGVLNTASLLHLNYGSALAKSKTVGLICPSTPDFLLTWLALIRLGYSVLLIAPQCTPAAIAALCAQTSTSLLFHDDVYASLAHEATAAAKTEGRDVEAAPLPFALGEPGLASILASEPPEHVPQVEVEAGDVAYLHHTSGTSSGIPKPIPQTHRGAAGVLPAFSGPQHAMFTTTPMYHGGPADCFRAWTSGAMIWLFPGKDIPITAANVIKCLDTAGRYAKEEMGPEVKYFASVPYVLQMMEADPRGLTYLEEMDIVGVGGAALPQEVGDRLVKKGVNLISRFGSAECGFLMSSHRDYRKDKEWQFLRSDKGVESLSFEKQDDGLAELVVSSGWPHMAKTNREDGSFATADLFAPHPSIPNAWRYHSRADSQLTLITGKKFDPAPLEGIISASEVLDDVLIFGDGQPFPGALLFRSETAREIGDEELVEQVWPTIAKLNSKSQDHARIPKRMLVPMQVLDKSLEKSSKGSLLRGAAESRFRDTIDAAYTNTTAVKGDVPDERVLQALKDMIATIVPPRKGELEDDTDLFSYGVDSVAGMQIRHGLRQLLPQESNKLPLNVVEDCGTIARLADYIVKQRHGLDVTNEDDELAMMERLVEECSDFRCKPLPKLQDGEGVHVKGSGGDDAPAADDDVVLLTGATGALGAHLLDSYRQQESVSKIYCLVRGADQKAAKERINKALEQRSLSPLSNGDGKVVVLRADLGDPYLGLNNDDYTLLAREISIVMHVAWSVNFRMRLRSFVKDNIAGKLSLSCAISSSPTYATFANLLVVGGRREKPNRPLLVDAETAAAVLRILQQRSKRGNVRRVDYP